MKNVVSAVASEKGRCNCTALRKASRRISQLYDLALAPSGLKATQRAILAQIGRSGTCTVGALAEALVMDRGALAHTLKPLDRDGFLQIRIDPEDRRNRLICLTPAGQTKLVESDALWERAQKGFETAFGYDEAERLRAAMHLLIRQDFIKSFERALVETLRDPG